MCSQACEVVGRALLERMRRRGALRPGEPPAARQGEEGAWQAGGALFGHPPFNFNLSFLADMNFLYFKKLFIQRLGFMRVLLGADLSGGVQGTSAPLLGEPPSLPILGPAETPDCLL